MKLLACVYVCVSFVIWQISLPFNVNYGMPKMKLHEVFVQYLTSLLCVCVCVISLHTTPRFVFCTMELE